MESWIVEYWPWSFILAWLIGAWGLSLPLYGGFLRRTQSEKFSLPAMRLHSAYLRIDYRIPGRSIRALADIVDNAPDGRSIYLRTEFFLRYSAEFRPDDVLREWFCGEQWAEERRLWAQRQMQEQRAALSAIRHRDVDKIYSQRRIPKEKPLALTFPLLPSQFTLFVAQVFEGNHQGQKTRIASGFYRCHVKDWRDDDSYAEKIELQNMEDQIWCIDQKSLLDALRACKAAVESVNFLNLPIFIFAGPNRKVVRLRPGQRVESKIPIRPATPSEFSSLDARLLKLFGGVNPLNLLRLSWFYHPEYGVKPDPAKYRRLVGRAGSQNDAPVSR